MKDYAALLKQAYLRDKVKYMSHLNHNIRRYNYLYGCRHNANVNMFDMGQKIINLQMAVGYQLQVLVNVTGINSLPIGDKQMFPQDGEIKKTVYSMNDFYKLIGFQNKMDKLGWQLNFQCSLPENCHLEEKIMKRRQQVGVQ